MSASNAIRFGIIRQINKTRWTTTRTGAAAAVSCRPNPSTTAGSTSARKPGGRVHTIYLSPCGTVFAQEDAKRLSRDYDRLILVCGHYEGVDERFVEECVDEEISIGDFVLTGGEIPAMAVADAICRLIPGVLPDAECFTEESHWDGLLEYPQYSRPEVWNGRRVPEILLSGHHANIARWRRKQSILRTRKRRPDLFKKLQLTGKQDQKILTEIDEEQNAEQ